MNHLAKQAPEYGRTDLVPAKSASDAKRQVHALIVVLAAYEKNLSDRTWRENGTINAAGRYLRFLSERCGYALSEVEHYAISDEAA